MKDSNDKAAPTLHDELAEALKEVRDIFKKHLDGKLSGEDSQQANRAFALLNNISSMLRDESPVGPSTEAGQTAHTLQRKYQELMSLRIELTTANVENEKLSKELQEAKQLAKLRADNLFNMEAERNGLKEELQEANTKLQGLRNIDDALLASSKEQLSKALKELQEARAALDSLREAAKRLTNYYNEFDTIDARDIEALDAALASSTSKENA